MCVSWSKHIALKILAKIVICSHTIIIFNQDVEIIRKMLLSDVATPTPDSLLIQLMVGREGTWRSI